MISVMRPFTLRRLTAAERALADEVFGAALDPARIRILALPVWPRAFVAGARLIVWPARTLPADFGDAALHLQAVFIHELTHIWQAKTGVWLPWAKLLAGDSAAAYAYDRAARPGFAELNIEQQAMVVQHAFLASRGAETPFPARLYAEILEPWRRA